MGYKMKIIFANSNTLGSWLIRKVTWGKWSHVGILDESNGYVLEASWPDGVRLVKLDKFLAKHSATFTTSVILPNEIAAFKWAYAQVGKPYDTFGILGVWARRNWRNADKWWCSEFVAGSAIAGGVQLIDVDMSRVTPEDLWKSPLLIKKEV